MQPSAPYGRVLQVKEITRTCKFHFSFSLVIHVSLVENWVYSFNSTYFDTNYEWKVTSGG